VEIVQPCVLKSSHSRDDQPNVRSLRHVQSDTRGPSTTHSTSAQTMSSLIALLDRKLAAEFPAK
jgi:hypothetical protein